MHIVYGKNLIDFKMERNIESVITGVHPYWQNSETGEVTELPEKVVLVEQRSVPYQKITVLDCTSGFQDKPTDEMMRSFAQDYLKNTSLTEPQVDIDIDFIQLWNTPDYEDVVEAEQVSLCDTVHVFISKLGIEVSSKVTRNTIRLSAGTLRRHHAIELHGQQPELVTDHGTEQHPEHSQ